MSNLRHISIQNEEILLFFKENKFINIDQFVLDAINTFKNTFNTKPNDANSVNVSNDEVVLSNDDLTLINEDYIQFNNSINGIFKKFEKVNKELMELKLNNIQKIINKSAVNAPTVKKSSNICKLCGKTVGDKKFSLRTHVNVHCEVARQKRLNKDDISVDTNLSDEVSVHSNNEIIPDKTGDIKQTKK
jgi:hypothetical protein